MGAALVLLLVGLGAMAAGVLIGRYYVPDDRQLRRTARHSKAYMRALSHLIARDHDTVVSELRTVVEENVEDAEPYFALGAIFRSRGEHERAIRVHQALAVRERDKRKLRQRAMYELGLDFRAAGMPRRATRAMEEVVLQEPGHEGALRVLATPGHTPGHICLVDDDTGDVFVGDCVGTFGSDLARPPAMFTADHAELDRSLHRLLELGGRRMYFSHGDEIDDPWGGLGRLIGQ